jgi:hypothetical protein
MVGRVVQFLEIFRRVVSLIENQGDVLAFPAEHLVASDQIVQGRQVYSITTGYPGASRRTGYVRKDSW